jgi:hypothetical protein
MGFISAVVFTLSYFLHVRQQNKYKVRMMGGHVYPAAYTARAEVTDELWQTIKSRYDYSDKTLSILTFAIEDLTENLNRNLGQTDEELDYSGSINHRVAMINIIPKQSQMLLMLKKHGEMVLLRDQQTKDADREAAQMRLEEVRTEIEVMIER